MESSFFRAPSAKLLQQAEAFGAVHEEMLEIVEGVVGAEESWEKKGTTLAKLASVAKSIGDDDAIRNSIWPTIMCGEMVVASFDWLADTIKIRTRETIIGQELISRLRSEATKWKRDGRSRRVPEIRIVDYSFDMMWSVLAGPGRSKWPVLFAYFELCTEKELDPKCVFRARELKDTRNRYAHAKPNSLYWNYLYTSRPMEAVIEASVAKLLEVASIGFS